MKEQRVSRARSLGAVLQGKAFCNFLKGSTLKIQESVYEIA